MKVYTRGYSLVEIIIVLAIVGILVATITINSVSSGQQSRDAKRQSDLQVLQNAVELYKNEFGRYPEGCNAAGTWSGQTGTAYACPSGNTYIVGAAGRLFNRYIATLPLDPRLNGTTSGYVYRTNTDGSVYKILALNTVESELVSYTHPLKSCDIRPNASGALVSPSNTTVDTWGWCSVATLAALEPSGAVASYGAIPNCRMSTGANAADGGNGRFERSYAVWGGYAAPLTSFAHRAEEVRDTAMVICK